MRITRKTKSASWVLRAKKALPLKVIPSKENPFRPLSFLSKNSAEPNHRLLTQTLSLFTAITGRIMQISDRKASVAMGAATKTVIGASVASTVMGAVGSLGTASTGAALTGLAGAAKTTATLYWIGGLVGGGVAAGTIVLGASALGVGIYGSYKLQKVILGHSRRNQLSDREQIIVIAIHALSHSISETTASGKTVSNKELAIYSRIGISPVITELQAALDENAFADLKTYNRARLRGHLINLRSIQKRLEKI